MTNSISEFEHSSAYFVIGSNMTEAHPIIALRLKRGVRYHGAKLIVADPREIPLTRHAVLWLRHHPGTDAALLNGIMHVILGEGLEDKAFIKERTENIDALKALIEKYTPAYTEEITGVPQDKIVEAARIIGSEETVAFFYAMGITQHIMGTENVMTVANLAMLTGSVGRPGTGVNPLRGQSNVQGACDMGGLYNYYPGYQRVDLEENWQKFSRAWNCDALSREPGLSATGMVDAAIGGKIKALYVMGENPLLSDPDIGHTEKAFENLDFLVVQDIFLTETAALADVVLPASAYVEKDGTFTNTERRVQRIRKAMEPAGQSRVDWEIIVDLSCRMGYPMHYRNTAEIMEEIASVTPIYGGISHERLEKVGLQWPCPDRDHPGTPYLHRGKFTRGKGLFTPVDYHPPAELPDVEYPFLLTTGRMLSHYHTGTMTRRSSGLNELCPEGFIELHPGDAEKLNIGKGEKIGVSSRRGAVEVKAWITTKVPRGVVYMNFHFAEAAANRLTIAALDPMSGIAEAKVCAVKIEKLEAQEIQV
jgi:formate dehydrogenase alpha subunit